MKLDVTCMRYLTKDDFRVLVAVEMGMRNHELVPVVLITSIAKLRHGGIFKILSTLLRYKLVAHSNQQYNGYRLSYLGFDILALRTLLAQEVIVSVGSQIGVGKESDIFEALDPNGNEVVIKIHRLGRTSFRAVRKQRDYMGNRGKANWLYMSRLAAIKEYAFMQALYAHEFPTPRPIAQNRHVVAMSRISGFPMSQLKAGTVPNDIAERIFAYCMAMLRRLAEHGLIHCDFNEFNLLLGEDGEKITLIDFPQMISTSHYNASELFTRDVNCLIKFFAMKMRYIPPPELTLKLEDIEISPELHLDEEVRASGFSNQEDDELMQFILESAVTQYEGGNGEEEEEEVDEEVDEEVEVEGEAGDVKSKSTVFEVVAAETEEVVVETEEGGDDEDEDTIEDILMEGEQVVNDDSDDEEFNEDYNANAAQLSPRKLKEIKEQVKRNMHQGGRKQSRNSTKKRNKYGKIDRNAKLDY